MSTKSKEAAEAKKLEGNSAFVKQDFRNAERHYTDAINLDSTQPVFYTNRAAALLKLGRYSEAKEDCSKALELDSTNVKALFRRADSLKHLGHIEEANRDLLTAQNIAPDNQQVKDGLRTLSWELKKHKRTEKENRTLSAKDVKASSVKMPSTDRINTPRTLNEVAGKLYRRYEIPVETVDSLPREFDATVNAPPVETDNKQSFAHTKSTVESARKDIQYPERPTLYNLTNLLRRPEDEKPAIYRYFFNLPADSASLNALFGRAGLETDFLEAFLRGIIQEKPPTEATQQVKEAYATKASLILSNLPKCLRFSIAKVFADSTLIGEALRIASSLPNYHEIKQAWA